VIPTLQPAPAARVTPTGATTSNTDDFATSLAAVVDDDASDASESESDVSALVDVVPAEAPLIRSTPSMIPGLIAGAAVPGSHTSTIAVQQHAATAADINDVAVTETGSDTTGDHIASMRSSIATSDKPGTDIVTSELTPSTPSTDLGLEPTTSIPANDPSATSSTTSAATPDVAQSTDLGLEPTTSIPANDPSATSSTTSAATPDVAPIDGIANGPTVGAASTDHDPGPAIPISAIGPSASSSTTPADAATQLTLRPDQLASTLMDAVRAHNGTSPSRLSVTLNPDQLGTIQIEIQLVDNTMNIVAAASHDAGRAAIESVLPELRAMASSSVRIADITVNDPTTTPSEQHSPNARHGQGDAPQRQESHTDAQPVRPATHAPSLHSSTNLRRHSGVVNIKV
jgi:flagellar hook-length control protein FliK